MDLYKAHILDHYRSPQNYGKMTGADLVAAKVNPTCGDQITLYIKFKKERVKKITFTGGGCAISMASASLLTQKCRGMSIDDILKMNEKNMKELLGVELNPARLKCAILCLRTLQEALKEKRNKNR